MQASWHRWAGPAAPMPAHPPGCCAFTAEVGGRAWDPPEGGERVPTQSRRARARTRSLGPAPFSPAHETPSHFLLCGLSFGPVTGPVGKSQSYVRDPRPPALSLPVPTHKS